MGPVEGAADAGASAPDAGPAPPLARALQIPDNLDELPHKERVDIVAKSWRASANPIAPTRQLHNLHRITLLCILNNEWTKLEESQRKDVIEAIECCADALLKDDPTSLDEKRLRYLIETANDPWHHSVLKDIMRGVQPESQDVLAWLREEGCSGALERLRQLCAAKGAAEQAALRLATALAPLPPAPQTLPPYFRCHAMDALLVLLMRSNRTADCIAHIKAMDMRVAFALISRLATRNKSHGRVWKSAYDTALLCTQVLFATCMVRPVDNQLGALAARLASFYATRTDELAPTLRKLIHSADTANHIYIVCRAVQHQFGESMRPFICELYIRALTTGVNELERLKHRDEASAKTAHQLADWFLSLAELLASNLIVKAECVLTAFSLHPSKHYYQLVKDSSIAMNHFQADVKQEPQDTEVVQTLDKSISTSLSTSTTDNSSFINTTLNTTAASEISLNTSEEMKCDLSETLAVKTEVDEQSARPESTNQPQVSANSYEISVDTNLDGQRIFEPNSNQFYLPQPVIEVDCEDWTLCNVDDEAFFKAVEGLENNLRELQVKKMERAEALRKLEESMLDDRVPQSLVSGAVLEGEGLGLSSDLCHDLVVLLSGPRLKMLTWDLSWEKLSEYCLSYMADTEEGTKTVTTELKYVHLDYSQFEIKEPETHDIYFGIEKGYEHHLEIEEGDWSDEYSKHRYDGYGSGPDADHRRSKKKSSKKYFHEGELKPIKVPDKIRPKKEKKPPRENVEKISKPKKVKNTPFNMNTLPNVPHVKTEQSQPPGFVNPMHYWPNTPYGLQNQQNATPAMSFYRKQMELHEVYKKRMEAILLHNHVPKTEDTTVGLDASSQNQPNTPMSYYNQLQSQPNTTYQTETVDVKPEASSHLYSSPGALYPNPYSQQSNNYSVQTNSENSGTAPKKPKSSLLLFRKPNVKASNAQTAASSNSYLNSPSNSRPMTYSSYQGLNKYQQYTSSPATYSPATSSDYPSFAHSSNMPIKQYSAKKNVTTVPQQAEAPIKTESYSMDKISTMNELSMLRQKLIGLTGQERSHYQDDLYTSYSSPNVPSSNNSYSTSSVHSPSNQTSAAYNNNYQRTYSMPVQNNPYNQHPMLVNALNLPSNVKQENSSGHTLHYGSASQVKPSTSAVDANVSFAPSDELSKLTDGLKTFLNQYEKPNFSSNPQSSKGVDQNTSTAHAQDLNKRNVPTSVMTANYATSSEKSSRLKDKTYSDHASPKKSYSNQTLLRKLLFGNAPAKTPQKESPLINSLPTNQVKTSTTEQSTTVPPNSSATTSATVISKDIPKEEKIPEPFEQKESIDKTRINQQSDAIYVKFFAEMQSLNEDSNNSYDEETYCDSLSLDNVCISTVIGVDANFSEPLKISEYHDLANDSITNTATVDASNVDSPTIDNSTVDTAIVDSSTVETPTVDDSATPTAAVESSTPNTPTEEDSFEPVVTFPLKVYNARSKQNAKYNQPKRFKEKNQSDVSQSENFKSEDAHKLSEDLSVNESSASKADVIVQNVNVEKFPDNSNCDPIANDNPSRKADELLKCDKTNKEKLVCDKSDDKTKDVKVSNTIEVKSDTPAVQDSSCNASSEPVVIKRKVGRPRKIRPPIIQQSKPESTDESVQPNNALKQDQEENKISENTQSKQLVVKIKRCDDAESAEENTTVINSPENGKTPEISATIQENTEIASSKQDGNIVEDTNQSSKLSTNRILTVMMKRMPSVDDGSRSDLKTVDAESKDLKTDSGTNSDTNSDALVSENSNNFIIDLLSDNESSDIEIMVAKDPIAVDPIDVNIQSVEQKSDDKFPPILPLFFTVVPNVKPGGIKKLKRRRKSRGKMKRTQCVNSESLIIYNEDSSKIIKVSEMPIADRAKLQQSCFIKLAKTDLFQLKKQLFPEPFKKAPKSRTGSRNNSVDKRKDIKSQIRTRSSQNSENEYPTDFHPRKIRSNSNKSLIITDVSNILDDSNDLIIDIKKEVIDTNSDSPDDSDDKQNQSEQINHSERNGTCDNISNGTMDILDLQDLNGDANQPSESADKGEPSHSKIVKPDVLAVNNFNVKFNRETNSNILETRRKSEDKASMISCSKTCPDLIKKMVGRESNIATCQPDIIPEKCKNIPCERSLDSDNVNDAGSENNWTTESLKTYRNNCPRQSKRKMSTDASSSLKKVRTCFKIDLPKTSKSRNTDQHQVNIEEEDFYDRAQIFTVKQFMLLESEDVNAEVNTDEDSENAILEINQALDETDVLSNVSKNNIGEEINRDNIYSPIFSDYDVIDETMYDDNDMHNHPNLEKGFDDWSDRGSKKDSSRGSIESLAAVLSDVVTTRPPLAQHNRTNRKSTEFTTISSGRGKTNENSLLAKVKEITDNFSLKLNKKNFRNNGNLERADFLYNSINNLMGSKKNWKLSRKFSLSDKEDDSEETLFDKVIGLRNYDFIKPRQTDTIVQVVQLGQMPVTNTQQNSLSDASARTQSTDEFLNLNVNSVDMTSPQNDVPLQSNDVENDLPELGENNVEPVKPSDELNKPNSEASTSKLPSDISDVTFDNGNINPNSSVESQTLQSNSDELNSDKPTHVDLTQTVSEESFPNTQPEVKDNSVTNSNENHINIVTSTAQSFITSNRGQALVNLLSQKLIHSPVAGQHVQMTTFPKGATINALSLQQALAQILPSSLSQSTSVDSVIHTAGHSQVGTPQVVHIVQGKNSNQNNAGTFGNILVDNGQSSVINNAGTQVLHIVQGKSSTATSNSSTVLNQSQFSGLSLVDTGVQQGGNQVLHIVNTGVQQKNNAQVLKRVNLLTSITNSQGNNEQKMVQFVCKAPDGKSIQLNTQPQRGMVLRLQPIENSTFTTQKTETPVSIGNTSTQMSVVKSQPDQAQQELKSRSVYEENYAKFIQNSNQTVPSSPEKSVSLPKFNQAFGKSVYQDNNTVPKTEPIDNSQNSTSSTEQHSTSDLTTLNLGQIGHITNPPLLIRKAPQSNILHQNVMQQVKQSMPMNIQTIHGGVIYTRQIPVNIGGGQTINLITVPSSDILDEAQLQSIQKQSQDKSTTGEQIEPQVIKLVSQEQQQANNAAGQVDNTVSDDANQSFADQAQNNLNNHPLLTQMRIKVPMLGKGAGQVVTGARVVRPVLQIQRNIIPGSNPTVYQQLVLTTAPTIRQPAPTATAAIRPTRPTTHQESNLSSSTLEQLREFDMVLEQVKERSTVQPGSNSNSNFPDTSPQCQSTESSELDSPQPAPSNPQREVLYSIGPNQTVYVNQKVIAKTPTALTTTYGSSDSMMSLTQNSSTAQISHGLTNTVVTHSKPMVNAPKPGSKSIKNKPSKPSNPSNSSSTSKSAPVAAKTSLQKPLEDEQTTQRILYILAEYKEQVENSPDKDKPAPRRRSNPPTNPTTSSKRKKGSGGSSKKSGNGQSLQEMSPLGDDAGHTMGSEDSSCGLSQGECTDNSVQGPDNQSPQSSPQKSAKKVLFQPESDTTSPIAQQQRNVLIADGQTIAMTRPGTGKATAVLMPANYILPMSMVKGSQQITIVTNQGPKILSVPQGEGGTTNALFLQRLIGPAGLKPVLARPGQVRHVRLPANSVQNLQTFNLNSPNVTSNETTWVNNSAVNNSQPKLVVEYGSNPDGTSDNGDGNVEVKDENGTAINNNLPEIKLEVDQSNDMQGSSSCLSENILLDQSQNSVHDANMQNMDLPSYQSHIPKVTGNNALNLIQVHSLNPDCSKLYSVQNSGITSLIQLSAKSNQDNIGGISEENPEGSMDIQDSVVSQFERKDPNIGIDANISVDSIANQQTFILSHGSQKREGDILSSNKRDDAHWSTNDSVAASHSGNDSSPSFVNYENSPQTISRDEQQSADGQESGMRDISMDGVTRVLRHPYSPSTSPSGPRHLYHKMFITTPNKKTFNSDLVEHSNASTEEDKRYIQVVSISHPDRKGSTESMDVTNDTNVGRPAINQNTITHHSIASLRHKYAVMEHELRLQKSLSEECEDLGVDSPSASDLFPEAELLFAASPSSQFDQSQDGSVLASSSHISSSTSHVGHGTIGHHMSSASSMASNVKESRLSDQTADTGDESEFARMHPNTTFHSGEIEIIGEDSEDTSVNIAFRGSSIKHTPSAHIISKRGDVVRSVIEGIGNNGSGALYSSSKLGPHFSMVDMPRRNLNSMSTMQNSDDFSEGADDSMNSAESKDCLVNNKCLDEIVKRDLSLASTDSPISISSNIIQRNITQVIRHSSNDQLALSASDDSDKLHGTNLNELTQNGNFMLDGSNDVRPNAESGILKSIMLERDGRDGLTCSSPEQHSELFWESNSNSNQSEEHMPPAPPNLLDFSSEDSNKCCKSPLSCEETNSTDSSSLGGVNSQSHNSHPLRINSVIKTSSSGSGAAEGPILHSALISNNPNTVSQDISKKMPVTLNSIHKNDPSPDDTHKLNKNWNRKGSGRRRVISPQSLTTEINMGAEIETASNSEGVSIFTKPSGGSVLHSESSTAEESGTNRRVSLRGHSGVKRSCHCCGGAPDAAPTASTSSAPRRVRRKPTPSN